MLFAMPIPQRERELVRDFVEKQKQQKHAQLWLAKDAKSGRNFLVGTRQEAIDILVNREWDDI